MNVVYAETNVLGCIFLEPTLFEERIIDSQHFSEQRHVTIFNAMKEAVAQGKTIDYVIVATILGERLPEVGGVSYLSQLPESVPTTITFKHYQQQMVEGYSLFHATSAVGNFLKHPTLDSLDTLIKNLTSNLETTLEKEEKTTYEQLMEISEEVLNPGTEEESCLTSLPTLDQMTGGFKRGDLIIVAARPSVGKTAFALNLAANHCNNQGVTSVFSLEMPVKQLLKRIISREGRIHLSKWHDIQNRFAPDDYGAALRTIGKLTEWDLQVIDTKYTIAEIRASIRKRMKDRPKENHLVMIDYLQLIAPAVSRRDRRDLEVGEITRELKLLAIELNIPIVLLSQLSRNVESRQDKRPLMSDLRESGNIEQDADVIAFLYRDDYYHRQSEERNQLEVIIQKHRNGPTGVVKLVFEREIGVVEEG